MNGSDPTENMRLFILPSNAHLLRILTPPYTAPTTYPTRISTDPATLRSRPSAPHRLHVTNFPPLLVGSRNLYSTLVPMSSLVSLDIILVSECLSCVDRDVHVNTDMCYYIICLTSPPWKVVDECFQFLSDSSWSYFRGLETQHVCSRNMIQTHVRRISQVCQISMWRRTRTYVNVHIYKQQHD